MFTEQEKEAMEKFAGAVIERLVGESAEKYRNTWRRDDVENIFDLATSEGKQIKACYKERLENEHLLYLCKKEVGWWFLLYLRILGEKNE